VTDRPTRSTELAEFLRRVADVRVVGTEERWNAGPRPTAVVSDLTLTHPHCIRSLRRLRQAYGEGAVPLVCLLRSGDPSAHLEAKALGAKACLSADSHHELVADALVRVAFPGQEVADRIVSRSCSRAAEVLDSMFSTAQGGGAPSMAAVDRGVGPVLEAIKGGRLDRWLATVWAYDDATYQHCLLVTGYAASFAQFLGFSQRDRQALVRGALVHDVGKAKIPREILNKPGRLNDDEMAVMRTHAACGFDLLANGGECDAATLDAVRHHHEMLDGSGYPDGLRGDEIGDPVRLLTICDIYAALTERRPYKAPLPADEALRILAGMSGKLEPALLGAFAQSLQQVPRAAA
jgi:putative nucleotidyltransferase with HDIG domain